MPLTLSAQFVSVDQARKKASDFLLTQSPSSHTSKRSSEIKDLTLSYTYQQSGTPHIYVFNSGDEGFILTSADEICEDILGYSTHGRFNIDSLSPNLRYWLEQYNSQIAFALANKESCHKPHHSVKTSSRHDIEILVNTKWDQQTPYWNFCPKKGGTRCLTGCVATAMAQVMKVHRWPVTGTGSHTYTDTPDETGWGTGQTLTADFSEHTYDWDNMLNTYTTSTAVQDSAVALLMSDCGISVDMTYGTYSQGGSGAYTEYVPYALINFFGYDHATRHLYRDYYSDEDWSDLLYTELAAGRPIMYGGSNYSGGHSFICDGYDNTSGKFHFNFGWSGSGDGYFALTAIGSERYNYYNDIVIGIQPEAGGIAVPSIIFYDDCYLESKETQDGDYTTYDLTFGQYKYNNVSYPGFIWNNTWCEADLLFTMKYTNTETGKTYYAAAKNDSVNRVHFDAMYEIEDYPCIESLTVKDVIVPKLPAGKYRVSIAYKDWADKDDETSPWQDVLAFTSAKNYVALDVASELTIPEITEISTITDSSFVATWTTARNAIAYTAELTATENTIIPDTTLLDEDFELVGGFGVRDASSELDQYTKNEGWTGSKIYCSDERFRVGASNSGWHITTPTLNVERMSRVKVLVTEEKYGTDDTTFLIEILKGEESVASAVEQVEGKDSKPATHEIVFDNIEGDFKVRLSNSEAAQRMYVDDIKVIAGGIARSSVHLYENITDTCYTFTNLTSDSTYYLRIKALSDYDSSPWSESIKIVMPSSILPGDANNDGCIDVADITAIASFILGMTPETWNADNADTNGDGNIDVADITATAAIILKED